MFMNTSLNSSGIPVCFQKRQFRFNYFNTGLILKVNCNCKCFYRAIVIASSKSILVKATALAILFCATILGPSRSSSLSQGNHLLFDDTPTNKSGHDAPAIEQSLQHRSDGISKLDLPLTLLSLDVQSNAINCH